jgi:hypothetical protein
MSEEFRRGVERECPDGVKSLPTALRTRQPRRNEGGDGYPDVAMLDPKTRIVECAAGIQWIIQKRVRAGGRYPWLGVYFCRTKEGLLLYARPITPELLALPDRFPQGGRWCADRNALLREFGAKDASTQKERPAPSCGRPAELNSFPPTSPRRDVP